MPEYTFKLTQETIWFVVLAILGAILVALSDLEVESVADWNLWLSTLGVSVGRAAIAAFLAAVGPGGFAKS